MEDEACLELTDICKSYAGRTVLNGVSMRVSAGECVCITGENGCGKSTLLKIAAGLTRPSGGKVVQSGNVQYVPDQFPPLAMTGRQFLRSMARVDNVPDAELVRRFRLEAYLDQSIATYSRGMRSKIGVLQALLADARLLLLDEPVSGQDAQAGQVFIAAVKERMARGCAVVIACHERNLIDALATRTYHISGGRLISGDWMDERNADGCLCTQCRRYADGTCAGRGQCHA